MHININDPSYLITESITDYRTKISHYNACSNIGIDGIRKQLISGSAMGAAISDKNPEYQKWYNWHETDFVPSITSKCDEYAATFEAIKKEFANQDLNLEQIKDLCNRANMLAGKIQLTIQRMTLAYLNQINLVDQEYKDKGETPTWMTKFIRDTILPGSTITFYRNYFYLDASPESK